MGAPWRGPRYREHQQLFNGPLAIMAPMERTKGSWLLLGRVTCVFLLLLLLSEELQNSLALGFVLYGL
jgi:hypothetical protein